MPATVDLSDMAYQLALEFVREDADRGFSEHYIMSTWHRHSSPDPKKWLFPKSKWTRFGSYTVSIGGYYDLDPETGLKRKKVPNTKVLVEEVCGVKGVWIFSLHQLYVESQKGQTKLL